MKQSSKNHPRERTFKGDSIQSQAFDLRTALPHEKE
jgi:hypothetical protein